jgi:hypothetical protein
VAAGGAGAATAADAASWNPDALSGKRRGTANPERETIAFALAPRRIDPNSIGLFFLDCNEVIDELFKAGALRLAGKLESKCRHLDDQIG